MKKNTTQDTAQTRPSEDDIRDYAYHLYVQSGMVEGNDVKNWLEAEACLCSRPRTRKSPSRAVRRKKPSAKTKAAAVSA